MSEATQKPAEPFLRMIMLDGETLWVPEKHAAFIARACNSHQDLMDALEAMYERFKDAADADPAHPVNMAYCAIAKAKGVA